MIPAMSKRSAHRLAWFAVATLALTACAARTVTPATAPPATLAGLQFEVHENPG